MRKFFILVKKEIQELLTLQTIAPLIAVVMIFYFIGNVVGKEVQSTREPLPVRVVDLDRSAASAEAISIFGQSGLKPTIAEGSVDEAMENAKAADEKAVLVIPRGFEQGINEYSPQKISFYYILENFSALGNAGNAAVNAALAKTNASISERLMKRAAPSIDPAAMNSIVRPDQFVVVGDRQANVSLQAISGFVSSQTYFIPIILMLVIIMASQLIAVSIASEKENKTLETLLSSPVSRQYIVAAKLLGAGIVALISAGIYMFGLSSYINGLTGNQAADAGATSAISQLGLAFGWSDYLLLGLSLFFGILVALAVAIILGSFAQDTKSAQGTITPLMILVLIPYFLTMFLDIGSMNPAARWAIYAIPFSHPFLAASDIMLGKTANVWYGIAYMAIIFLIFVYIASRIFASEKIFSLRINFGKLMKKG